MKWDSEGNMNIKVPIPVKMVITEKTRHALIDELQSSIKQLKMEIEQLRFQEKKLIIDAKKKGKESVHYIKERFSLEYKKRNEKLNTYQLQLNEVETIQNGEEIYHTTVESIVEIKVGDKWDKVMLPYEIIIKDGMIIEFRKQRK